MWYINLHPSHGAGIFRQLNAGPLSSPCKWSELAKRPCYGWVTDRGVGAGGQTHIFSANHLWIVPPQWSAITLLTPCLYKILRNPSESHPGRLCETGSWCVSSPCNSLCHLHTERPISCFATVAPLKKGVNVCVCVCPSVCVTERERTIYTHACRNLQVCSCTRYYLNTG